MAGSGAFERIPLLGAQAAPYESESHLLRVYNMEKLSLLLLH